MAAHKVVALAAARTNLRAAMRALKPEQLAGIASLSSVDDDADGLTNTEEIWWCTDPMNPNSDGDAQGYTDGQEVAALLDFTLPRNVRWGYGPPFGPPAAWPDFNGQDGNPATPACNDGDYDTIPDYAEAFMVGTRVGTGDSENTDGDKFDDGQELFGITFCPGGTASCGWGNFPRTQDYSFITSGMPSWIRPPGDSPFVAAYPVIDFLVDPATIEVTTKEIRTIERTITQGEEISTGFAETQGNSTTVGTVDTNTHSTWQENSTTEGGIEPRQSIASDQLLSYESTPKVSSIPVEQFAQFDLDRPRIILPEDVQGDWVNYSDPLWHFSIQYPVTWTAAINYTNPPDSDTEVIKQQLRLTGPDGAEINLDVWQKSPDLDLMSWLRQYQLNFLTAGGVSLPPTTNATIAGQEAMVLSQQGGCAYPPIFYAYISANDRLFRITYIMNDRAKNLSVYERILTNFVCSTDSTARIQRVALPTLIPFYTLADACTGFQSSTCCNQVSVLSNHLCARRNLDQIELGNCVWWAAARRPDLGRRIIGNAGQWAASARSANFDVDNQPRVGDIMVCTGTISQSICDTSEAGVGHVAYVTAVNGNQVSVTEMNWCATCNQSNTYSVQGMQFIHGSRTTGHEKDPCDVPQVNTPVPYPAPTPPISSNQRYTNFLEIIGRAFKTWWGRLTGANALAQATGLDASLPGCDIGSCAAQVVGSGNYNLNFSDSRSAGQCGGNSSPGSGSDGGVGGGGSGLALNDTGSAMESLRVWSQTTTNGEGWSTSHSELRSETQYSEITRSRTNTLVSSEAWSTATTIDPTDAAVLTFNYSLYNTGSDAAVHLTGIKINIMIGDLPVITHNLPDSFDILPGQAKGPFGSGQIKLTLDQLAAIDNGAPIRIVLADYGYDDNLYDANAWGRSVLFHVDDGTADGDETIDTYLITTNLVQGETYQDTLARYFAVTTFQSGDERNGTITNIRTPEYAPDGEIIGWNDHPVNEHGWWEVSISLGGETANVKHFKDMPAKPKTDVYLRYVLDTDADGYTDRAEQDAGTDPANPASHPRVLLAVAQHTRVDGNTATVQVSLQNEGNFDASSVELWAIAPDDSITLNDNLVGGGGRVRAGRQIVLGARIGKPDLSNWTTSTAKPYPAGQFEGAGAKTYTFRADASGNVGTTTGLTISWSDNGGSTWTPLAVGAGYTLWTPLALADGLTIAFSGGYIAQGETFNFQTALPIDTFSYTINRTPYSRPLIIVSYNDPEGNHKFVTDVEVAQIQADLTPYLGQMRFGFQMDVMGASAVTTGTNTAYIVFNNPSDQTIRGGNVFVEFATPDGVVAKEYVLANQIFEPGPNVATLHWNTADFSPAFDPLKDYHILAFAADRQGTIFENTVKDLDQLGKDRLPAFAMADADATWDFGTAAQGTLLKRSFTFANTGALDLLTYVSAPEELTISQTGSRRLYPADMTTYEMALDTTNLPLGPYTGTVVIRTSDPERPTRTLTVRGTITAYTPDTPPGSLQRPLDWSATFASGTQGQWVEFTHTLGPTPQTLHPVKVYSQNYGTLWGVGKYATPFGQGTASYDMFGDGRDGVMPSSGNLDNNNGVGVGIVNSGSAGSYYINVTDAYAVWRINPGDVVLIHQTQGTNAGCWELNRAVSDFGGGTATYQLEKPLRCNYASGGNNHAQIQRVPQYTDCPVSGTVTPLASWNGSWGGIFGVMCNSTMNLTGAINATAYGFRGGLGGSSTQTRQTGEGIFGYSPLPGPSAGNNGGGSNDCGGGWLGGAGGGHANNGENGGKAGGTGSPSIGGYAVGTSDLTTMDFGGGGGGGGYTYGGTGGTGGKGGGIVFISANNLVISGSITNGGSAGGNGGYSGGYGNPAGGGAGGSILLRARTTTLGSALVTALKGNGGVRGGDTPVNGGAGSVGRIRIEYCESLSGSTNPPASTQKLNCYIVEQVESVPYDRTRLNLPETFSGGRTYQVQYGQRLVFGGAGEQTATLRVPAGAFATATLDALVSEVGSGSLTFRLDIGNDGSWDWEWTGNVNNAATLNSSNLAAAFSRYWATHGAPTSGNLDVPVRASLSKAGQVLLTNLQMTPTGSKMRYVRLPARTYSSVTLGFTVSDGSGPLTVAADVGDDGTVDWAWSGTPTYPARLTTGNLATAFNAYLAGRSGEMNVPVRFYVAPFLPLGLTDFSATPSVQPDATITASDIAFGAADPTEGETVPVTATLHNNGGLDTGGLTAAFYATAPGWGEWYIGSAFVPNVPTSGTAQASISWNTLGFTGTVPVRVVVDPYNRVAETNEDNNIVTMTLTIRTRPDLQVTQVALSDDEPMAGETVTVTLTLRNHGQTTAGSLPPQAGGAGGGFTVALYQGNPDAGGTIVGAQGLAPLPGGNTTTVAFAWTPTAPGPYFLFARVDQDNAVNEYDEGNNETWRDVYVGLASPVLLDSGGASDVAYAPARGYGYVDEGQPDTVMACGSQPHETLRLDPGGRVTYHFDHLLPGHFYHLDITLYECDGAGRQESIYVDGNPIAGPEDLSDGRVHRLSLRLDPALYADRSAIVTVQAPGIDGAVVSAVNLYDIDYRYADAGGGNDPQYPSVTERPYGWLDGVANTAWGILPYQSVRVDQSDNTLRYRFDRLDPAKSYQLHLTFWQPSGTARIQKVQIDGADTGTTVNTGDYQVHRIVLDVPRSAYASDGSIIVGIVRTNAATGAFVNEVALEELTLTAESVPPVADFTASPTSGYAPLTVQFTDRSSGAITDRVWNFGDGGTDTVPNPVHTYNATGVYTVSLTVSGPGGSNALIRTNFITVTETPPTATVVRISPASASANAGVPITVAVAISNVTNLGSFQFTLAYSPSLVMVQNVTLSGFPGSTGRSFTPVGPTIDNTGGTATFGAFSIGSTPAGANGSGALAYVRLLPVGGGTASLHLQGVQVTNVPGQAISIFTQDGTLVITACLGDFDGDSDVDILDVQRIAYRWNTHTGDALYEPTYDLDSDGDIDILDVQRVAYRWGTRCGGATSLGAELSAIQQAASLSVQPALRTVTVGQVFTVGMVISDAVDLGAFEFTLGYTPTVVEVITATLGAFPGSTGRTFTVAGTVINPTAGTVTFGAYSMGATPQGPSGSGTLAVLTLRALAEGQSVLAVRSAQVSDRVGNPQTVAALSNGRVEVRSEWRLYLPLVVKNYP